MKYLIGICLFFIVMFFIGCYSVVPPGHRGISVTMGKVYPMMIGEGFTLKKPFIENIIKFSIQQQTESLNTAAFSSDLQTIQVAYSVMYRIPEGKVVELYQQYAGDPFNSLAKPRAEESLKRAAAMYRAEEVVKKRDEIKSFIMAALLKEMGGMLEIRDVVITNIDLTDEMEKAIELKQVTEQQALAKEYELKKATKEAEITVINAKAEAESVKIKGEALANAPRVIELEIAKKWDGKTPQSVVTGAGGANVLLPLK